MKVPEQQLIQFQSYLREDFALAYQMHQQGFDVFYDPRDVKYNRTDLPHESLIFQKEEFTIYRSVNVFRQLGWNIWEIIDGKGQNPHFVNTLINVAEYVNGRKSGKTSVNPV